MKKKYIIIGILIIGIAVLYLIPITKGDFFEKYNKNDDVSQLLKEFYKKPTKTISVNGLDWTYYTSGKGSNTILFIHGMGGAYDLWWQQLALFEKDYKVISFSLPDAITNLEDTRKGIEGILANEDVNRFNVVGTSMGGYIAQYLVKTMPNRVKKAVFGNTFPPNDEIAKENQTKNNIIPLLPEILIGYFRDKSLKEKLLPAANNNPVLTAFLPSLPFTKKQFINRYYVVIDPFTINPNSSLIKQIPKLIIESDNDPLISLNLQKELKELYPNAEVFTFHNEGHFPYINAADAYNQTLKQFFDNTNMP
ncbi:alpha/beta fold hydrolase [Bizionia arctica]|nr:alpha/beta hydrolase [Bizionia arctica]